jgi:hypothetical protein
MFTRIANTDFPTKYCSERSLEELRQRYGKHIADKFILELYNKLNPKQKQPKKKQKAKTKVDKTKD